MKTSTKSLEQIAATIQQAVSRYAFEVASPVVTDFQLFVNQESGEFIISNDDDEQLGVCLVEEWKHNDDDDFITKVEDELTVLLRRMDEKKNFDSLIIFRPYSFVLIDDDGETITDLLFIDDDTLMLTQDLLVGLDEELNDFLTHLLED